MKIFKTARTRLLVISQDTQVLNDITTMLTGYEYYVDYQDSLAEGIKKFRAYKHAVVIVDSRILPKTNERLFSAFHTVQQYCMVLTLVAPEKRFETNRYLDAGAYDVVFLPLIASDLHQILRRMDLTYNAFTNLNFYKLILTNVFLILPILLGLVWVLNS